MDLAPFSKTWTKRQLRLQPRTKCFKCKNQNIWNTQKRSELLSSGLLDGGQSTVNSLSVGDLGGIGLVLHSDEGFGECDAGCNLLVASNSIKKLKLNGDWPVCEYETHGIPMLQMTLKLHLNSKPTEFANLLHADRCLHSWGTLKSTRMKMRLPATST